MAKPKTKEEILESNGFDFEAFKLENEYSAKNLLLAMEQYSEQNCDKIQSLFTKPMEELKPLEDLYRKENPHPEGKFYLPDITDLYRWIKTKLIPTTCPKCDSDNIRKNQTYTDHTCLNCWHVWPTL